MEKLTLYKYKSFYISVSIKIKLKYTESQQSVSYYPSRLWIWPTVDNFLFDIIFLFRKNVWI